LLERLSHLLAQGDEVPHVVALDPTGTGFEEDLSLDFEERFRAVR